MKKWLGEIKKDLKGIRKEALGAVAVIEFMFIGLLLCACLVFTMQIGAAEKISDDAMKQRDICKAEAEEYKGKAQEYKALLELSKEEFKEYQEANPVINWRALGDDTRIDHVITPKDKLSSYMKESGIDKYYSADYLYSLSSIYKIDPGFVLSTFILETGWGKESQAWLNGHNPAGIREGSKYCYYDTPEDGMEAMYKLLRAYADGSISYVGKCNTVATVRSTWSSSEDTTKIVSLWRSIYD